MYVTNKYTGSFVLFFKLTPGSTLHLDNELAGFGESPITHDILNVNNSKEKHGETLYDIRHFTCVHTPQPKTKLLVYTDLITPQLVGDTYARVLRTITVQVKPDERQSVRFNSPVFFPVESNSVKRIHIAIRDDKGEYIDFQSQLVRLTLAIRPRL